MKEPNNVYSVVVNGMRYSFECPDGDMHVDKMKSKINDIIHTLPEGNSGPKVSNYAMKMILLLADEVVRCQEQLDKFHITLDEKAGRLKLQLENALDVSP